MKRKRKHKAGFYIILAIISIFIAYNVFWYICIYKPYVSLGEMIGEREEGYYWSVEGEISYYVAPPVYLDVTGNLAIGPATIGDGDDVVSLIIWRNIDGTYRVGVSLETYEIESDGTVKYTSDDWRTDRVVYVHASQHVPS